jgi:UDP-N-acetylmuramoyl-L-alanyl-D-glutamate--2,6-diaminopimelate ligase
VKIQLEKLLEGVAIERKENGLRKGISSIAIDSRKAVADSLFIAIKGTRTDGHKFIEKAIEQGATTIVCENWPDNLPGKVTCIKVKDSAEAASRIAHVYFDKPSEKLELVGITGTNGKSTVATLLYGLMRKLGYKAGLISTIDYRIDNKVVESTHTTPDPIRLSALLSQMVDEGCRYAFMEVSSHALDQKRTVGLNFKGGVFTNLSHDHLDYHGSFMDYINTKKKFFDALGAHAFALINSDDPRANVMVQNTRAKVSKFSLLKIADFKARILSNHIEGLHMNLDSVEMHSRLVGAFNAYNLLAVFGVAVLLEQDRMEVITALSDLGPAEGRFELIRDERRKISAIVDYAHTPDALQKVLSTLHQLKREGKVIVVVGCGGDRDKLKRPKMASIAVDTSDLAILTSDNPRSEAPESILDDMMRGIPVDNRRKVIRNSDRREAIRTAIKMAHEGDVILVAGKGHEKYQEIDGKKLPFDDVAIIKKEFNQDI